MVTVHQVQLLRAIQSRATAAQVMVPRVTAGYGVGYGNGLGPAANGASYAAMPGQLPGDPYYYHFGPGFYRQQEAGHYTFPYNSYRRPWYFPGHTSYNRDTNIPW